MNLPPALTWLELFPSQAAYACDESAPPSRALAEMLSGRASGGSADAQRVLISQNKPFHQMVELPKWDGIVSVNGPGVTAKRLEASGFAYARAFAVLPNLQKARWFVPLDSGTVAAAGFSLYTPSRRSAHWKKRLVRLAARLRMPMWYRDSVVIAARQPPPLEQKLADLFANQMIRVALSSGAPEPAINRKPSASVIDGGGNVLAFVKIAVSEVSRRIVEHEAEMLVALADHQHLRGSVPRLLFAGEVDGRYVTVQSPLQGTPASTAITPQHAKFLDRLRSTVTKPAAETNIVSALGPRIDRLHPPRPELREALEAILPTLERARMTPAIIHGDFAPWNLRTRGGKLAAFDWEYAEIDGLPLIDEIHFRLQVGLEMEKWDVATAAGFLRELRDDGSLTFAERRAIACVYLLDHLARLYGEGYSAEHEMVALYHKLLDRLDKREPALV